MPRLKNKSKNKPLSEVEAPLAPPGICINSTRAYLAKLHPELTCHQNGEEYLIHNGQVGVVMLHGYSDKAFEAKWAAACLFDSVNEANPFLDSDLMVVQTDASGHQYRALSAKGKLMRITKAAETGWNLILNPLSMDSQIKHFDTAQDTLAELSLL